MAHECQPRAGVSRTPARCRGCRCVRAQSTNKEGSYRDDTVAALVRAHNLATRDLSDLDNPGSFPPY